MASLWNKGKRTQDVQVSSPTFSYFVYSGKLLTRKGCGLSMSRQQIDCDFGEKQIGQKCDLHHDSASRPLLAIRKAREERVKAKASTVFPATEPDCGLEMTPTVLKKLFHVLKTISVGILQPTM